ncbi:hypothetical protein CPB85DRAFT_1451385 [Mucidula mucida]|nr:hypothetical protein CPB85DRAFT_1451385 [Mucidula mucida]
MTIRYERSTFPGGYRPYDDHLNPQIDTLDTGKTVLGLTLPQPSQRYASRTVDLDDAHPVDEFQLPRLHLDGVAFGIIEDPPRAQIRLPNPLRVPSIASPRFGAPLPLSTSSQSHNPLVRPRRKPGWPLKPTGNDKLTPSNLSLLDRTLNIPALNEPSAPGIDHLFIRPVPRLTRPLPSKSPQMRLRQLHTPPPPPTPESPLFASMVRACSDRIVSAVKASCVQLLVKERAEKDALRRELDELKSLHLVPPHSADIVRPRTPFHNLKRPSTAPPSMAMALKKRRFEEATVVDDDNWIRRVSRSESVNSELTQVDDAEESFKSALDLGVYRKLEQLGSSRASSRSSHSSSSRGTVIGNDNDLVLAKLFE